MTESTFGSLYLNRSDEKIELFNQRHNIEANLSDQEIHGIIRELPPYATPEILLKTLIGKLQDINSKGENDSETVLYWMLNNQRWGSQPIVSYLLERKANPNIPGKYEMTPVHLAAKNESLYAHDIMKLLLAAKGNPNAAKGEMETPIHLAAQNRSDSAPEIMNLLLNNTEGDKGDPNVIDIWKNTPLHLVTQNVAPSAPKILQYLLEKLKNANVSIYDNSSTVLYEQKNESGCSFYGFTASVKKCSALNYCYSFINK